MTTSGYPRVMRRWTRGTPVADAPVVFEGAETDVAAFAGHDHTVGFERDFVGRSPDFHTTEEFVLRPDGTRVLLDVPADADTEIERAWLLVRTRSPWTVARKEMSRRRVPGGGPAGLRGRGLPGGRAGRATVVFTPTASRSLAGWSWTRNHLVLTLLDDVATRLEVADPARGPGGRGPGRLGAARAAHGRRLLRRRRRRGRSRPERRGLPRHRRLHPALDLRAHGARRHRRGGCAARAAALRAGVLRRLRGHRPAVLRDLRRRDEGALLRRREGAFDAGSGADDRLRRVRDLPDAVVLRGDGPRLDRGLGGLARRHLRRREHPRRRGVRPGVAHLGVARAPPPRLRGLRGGRAGPRRARDHDAAGSSRSTAARTAGCSWA